MLLKFFELEARFPDEPGEPGRGPAPSWPDSPMAVPAAAMVGPRLIPLWARPPVRDWPAIWPFLSSIVAAGETYCCDRDITEQRARALWLLPPPGRCVVAVDDAGAVLGAAQMHANQMGPGAHVATASFMIDPAAGGRGVGRALASTRWSGRERRATGQCSSTPWWRPTRAPGGLWRPLGFETVGTVPEAFRHPTAGFVGLHIMHRPL